MKITVLVGSPRANGNTEIMADEFIKGAKEVGHEVTKITLHDKNVAGCKGCEYCFAHDGECVQNDDMKDIIKVIDQTDCLVLASPIYWFDMTAQVKVVIDRLYARARKGYNISSAAMLLNSGSDGVYAAAKTMFEAMTKFLRWENKGIITIPGMAKKGSMKQSPELHDVYKFGRDI